MNVESRGNTLTLEMGRFFRAIARRDERFTEFG